MKTHPQRFCLICGEPTRTKNGGNGYGVATIAFCDVECAGVYNQTNPRPNPAPARLPACCVDCPDCEAVTGGVHCTALRWMREGCEVRERGKLPCACGSGYDRHHCPMCRYAAATSPKPKRRAA